MKKYLLKSTKFTGSVVFGYDERGYLVLYSNEAEMPDKHINWCAHNLPAKEEYLERYKEIIKGTITEVPMDTSFEVFWNAYAHKVNRKRCEPLYKKLTEADRALCIMSIKAYTAFLKRNPHRPKQDPENYLRKESFRNEWHSL